MVTNNFKLTFRIQGDSKTKVNFHRGQHLPVKTRSTLMSKSSLRVEGTTFSDDIARSQFCLTVYCQVESAALRDKTLTVKHCVAPDMSFGGGQVHNSLSLSFEVSSFL
ncbi:hypothetical protein J6590_003737 [Homalodisca vitripennis]|nr:hypothetical protein J6590_003737 [Homalodisca vitripennis]